MARNKAMGGHQSAAAVTTTWLTPPPILAALGGAESFDLDPCAAPGQPWATARRMVALPEDGLGLDWNHAAKSAICDECWSNFSGARPAATISPPLTSGRDENPGAPGATAATVEAASASASEGGNGSPAPSFAAQTYRQASADARGASRSALQTPNTSLPATRGFKAGAGPACESTPATAWPPSAQTLTALEPLATPGPGTDDQTRGVQQSARERSPTTTSDASGDFGSLTIGDRSNGRRVAQHGASAAPIAPKMARLNKTTSSRSATVGAPELFPETCFPRVGAATAPRAPEARSHAFPPTSLGGCCPICQRKPDTGRKARIWLNPPYSTGEVDRWLHRLGDHGQGTALIFARTETETFHRQVWERATGLLFLEGRLHFHYPDGRRAKANAGAPSVLCAYGADDLDRLAASDLPGNVVPLRFPRFVLVEAADGDATWREVVMAYVKRHSGPVSVSELYRRLARHPKARRNPNWRAKVRQTLQRGPFAPLGGGQWEVNHA